MDMMRLAPACALAVGVVTLTAPISAQQSSLIPGQWIRVSTRLPGMQPDWLVGSVATVTTAFLVLEPIGQTPLAIPHTSLSRIELNRGWTSRAKVGGALGVMVGLAVSAIAGMTADCSPWCLLGGGMAGGLAGGVIGHGMPRLRWQAIPPDDIRPRILALHPSRIGVGLRRSF